MKKINVRKIIFGATVGFIIAAGSFSCGNGKKSTDIPIKKDTIKQNPFHLPDSIPAKTGNIKAETEDATFRDFAFIAFGKYIILSASVDTTWANGSPEEIKIEHDGIYAAVTNVKTENLPKIYSSLMKQTFRIYSSGGDTTTSKITSFKLLSAFIPHFGQVQTWNGTNGDSVPFTQEQKNQDIWNSAALYLVAEFDAGEKGSDFYFATPATKNSFSIYSPPVKNEIEKNVLSAAAKTEEYIAAQTDFAEKFPDKKNKWWEDEEADRNYFSFEIPAHGIYSVISQVSGNPCGGEFWEEKFSIWQTKKNTSPKLVCILKDHLKILLAFDIDNDSIPEILVEDYFGKRSVLKKQGEEWIEFYIWNIPFQDCGC